MDVNSAEAGTGTTDTPKDETVQESFANLLASGRELADAEFKWAKIKAAIVTTALKKGSMFGALAAFFILIGLLLLVVAAVIALTPLIGLLGATLIVAAIAFLFAALLGIAAKNVIAAAFKAEEE